MGAFSRYPLCMLRSIEWLRVSRPDVPRSEFPSCSESAEIWHVYSFCVEKCPCFFFSRMQQNMDKIGGVCATLSAKWNRAILELQDNFFCSMLQSTKYNSVLLFAMILYQLKALLLNMSATTSTELRCRWPLVNLQSHICLSVVLQMLDKLQCSSALSQQYHLCEGK